MLSQLNRSIWSFLWLQRKAPWVLFYLSHSATEGPTERTKTCPSVQPEQAALVTVSSMPTSDTILCNTYCHTLPTWRHNSFPLPELIPFNLVSLENYLFAKPQFPNQCPTNQGKIRLTHIVTVLNKPLIYHLGTILCKSYALYRLLATWMKVFMFNSKAQLHKCYLMNSIYLLTII